MTGGGRGIGRTIALALADAGADVAVMARTGSQVDQVAREIAALGRRAAALPADVSDPEQVVDQLRDGARVIGPFDIVVNAAGNLLFQPLVPLPGYRPPVEGFDHAATNDAWRRTLGTHLDSTFFVLREVAPHMLETGWGRVVNIASSSVARAARYTTVYDTAKGAIVSLTRSLAKEWARYGVTVNAVGPGQFRTEMTKAMHDDPKGREWMLSRIPMRRPGELHELGPLVVFLCSDAASFVTGQLIFADGGESL